MRQSVSLRLVRRGSSTPAVDFTLILGPYPIERCACFRLITCTNSVDDNTASDGCTVHFSFTVCDRAVNDDNDSKITERRGTEICFHRGGGEQTVHQTNNLCESAESVDDSTKSGLLVPGRGALWYVAYDGDLRAEVPLEMET